MKRLIDCEKGEKVKVLKLDANYDLKQRLISFGVMKDAQIQVLEHAPRKKTIEVKVGKMRIALRAEEAELIEVEEV
ncbi:FeoA family protein [Sulfurimonas autotrophica]|uniref:FeoA family protein n=1 Tax=Sulfurimonas autotrophica (strain ATCC BAA-671 / DSM 16294 / JCM 11897 / OK10) TaxID=563040 RepID=E0UPA9_SULAO|nr:FeoA family protein [Sulfurimonas autotrophica]ADN08573.1 FeoA family protein [Sulfurimonas autotrophica DSM 16294]